LPLGVARKAAGLGGRREEQHEEPDASAYLPVAATQEAKEFVGAALEDPALRAALGGRRPAVVFCGDFNSDLNDGIPGEPALHCALCRSGAPLG
jgi:hypothetical protein